MNRILFVVLLRKNLDQSFKKNSSVIALERYNQSQRTAKIRGNMVPLNFRKFRFTLGVQFKKARFKKTTYTSRRNAFGELFPGGEII